MKTSTVKVRELLLDMLAPARVINREDVAALDGKDWANFNRMARQHRLASALHLEWQARGAEWGVPALVRTEWSEAYRTAALRALKLQATLVMIHDLLSDAGIHYVALKGATLAWRVYSQAAARPMRDLDILVAKSDVQRARDVIIGAGFVVPVGANMPDDYLFAHAKHLMGMYRPGLNINVELHFDVVHAGMETAVSGALDPAVLLDQSVVQTIGGRPVAMSAPTQTLLHLIVHAAYDHHFDNGPLVLTDVALLVREEAIDWDDFWRRAAVGGWLRGAHLLLDLAQDAHGELAIHCPIGLSNAIPERIRQETRLAMVNDFESREGVRHIRMAVRARSMGAFLGHFMRGIFAPRAVVAAWGSANAHGNWLPILYVMRFIDKMKIGLGAIFIPTSRKAAHELSGIALWLNARDA